MDPVIPCANHADPKVRKCDRAAEWGGGRRKDKSTLDVFGGGYIGETDWGWLFEWLIIA